MANANYATSEELRDIAMVADWFAELDERLMTRKSAVSFGEIAMFDVNGELLGTLESADGNYVFHAAPGPEDEA